MAAGPTVSRRMPRVTMLQPTGQPLPSLPCCTAAPPTHAPPVPAAARSLSAARQSVPGPPPCCVGTVGLDPLYFAPLCPLFNPRVAATSPFHSPSSVRLSPRKNHAAAFPSASHCHYSTPPPEFTIELAEFEAATAANSYTSVSSTIRPPNH
jgi:hypothetical protein